MKTITLVLIIGLLIILPFCFWGETIDAWFIATANAGTTTRLSLAILLFSALALDVFLPVPSSLASTLCGVFFGGIGGFLISFCAMTASCLIGWLVGTRATSLACRFVGESELPKLQRLLARYGILFLLALRAIPVFAEVSVLLAGIARLPFRKCFPLLTIGNAVISFTYVYAGVYGKNAGNMLPAFLISLSISAILMVGTLFLRRQHS